MGARRIRRNQRQADMAESRQVNGMIKDKERARRETRMLGLIQKGQYPYTPAVMSWLSTRLDKPARQITQDDVKQMVTQTKTACVILRHLASPARS